MNTIKVENYKEYEIEIHFQPKTGSNTKVFLGVWKNSDKVFSVWEQISRTEARSMGNVEAVKLLEKKGMDRIRKMIDDGDFKVGKEYRYWESAN